MTVIVVVPPDTPVIVAVQLSPSTVATSVLDDDHNTLLLVGADGLNISCTVSDEPLSTVSDEGLIVISPTGVVTYTTQVAFLITPLTFCVTLICAIPDAIPVTLNVLPSSD